MKNNLFITGANGFIGTHLLTKLNLNEFNNIYCLIRREWDYIQKGLRHDRVTFIRADINDHEQYTKYLALSDFVIHLAAITGKAPQEEYFRVNTAGTELLVQQCKTLKIRRFIYISSIATKFQDIKDYYYAQSKLKAEEIVKESSIKYTILRPTIVIGKDSPIFKSFLKLAKAPIVPIFGNGSAKIQPIYIDDLCESILYILKDNSFENQTLDLGGPEQITIEKFVRLLHKQMYKNDPKIIHLPLHFIKSMLRFSEKFILPILPFTSGQLTSFINNGVIDNNTPIDSYMPRMTKIDKMMELVIDDEKNN